MTRRGYALLAATAAFLLAGSTTVAFAGPGVAAKTVAFNNISSPNGKIRCSAQLDSKEIECEADYLHPIGDLDPYFGLRPTGKAVLDERGDFNGHSTKRRTLKYGETWKRPGGITCKMRTTGLTCMNDDDHGFHLQRGNSYRF
jgi:hypothetical protein